MFFTKLFRLKFLSCAKFSMQKDCHMILVTHIDAIQTLRRFLMDQQLLSCRFGRTILNNTFQRAVYAVHILEESHNPVIQLQLRFKIPLQDLRSRNTIYIIQPRKQKRQLFPLFHTLLLKSLPF